MKNISSFAQKVYQATKKIPRGKVATYSQIAIFIKNPKAARAVGNALHKNPFGLEASMKSGRKSSEAPRSLGKGGRRRAIIPCHRVVNKDGKLAKNFGSGGAKKQKELLEKEGVKIKNLKVDLEKNKAKFK